MTGEPSFASAGLGGEYDFVVPLGAEDVCAFALSLYGLRTSGSDQELTGASNVLAVYVVPPDGDIPCDDDLKDRVADLSARFPSVRFELLLVVSRRGLRNRAWWNVAPGFARVEADFHVKPSAEDGGMLGFDHRALAAVFSGFWTHGGGLCPGGGVFQLRNDEEAASAGWHRKGNCRLLGNIRLLRFKVRKGATEEMPLHRRETLLAKFRIGRLAWAVVRQHGGLAISQFARASRANSFTRIRCAISKAVQAPLLSLWGLKVKRKKFEHFLLLGYNCETAYRFLMANGFLDATFFAWTGSWSCDITLEALRRFDELFSADVAFSGDLFIDAITGLSMHSRMRDESAGDVDVEAEKADLRSRVAHLREKFYRQLRDDEPTLAALKLSPADCARGDELANRLVSQLTAMGGRNFRLLVVCQKADAAVFPRNHPAYELRTVSRFSPDWDTASEQAGDRLGWMKIWREFAPARKIVQHKTYKFQKKGA